RRYQARQRKQTGEPHSRNVHRRHRHAGPAHASAGRARHNAWPRGFLAAPPAQGSVSELKQSRHAEMRALPLVFCALLGCGNPPVEETARTTQSASSMLETSTDKTVASSAAPAASSCTPNPLISSVTPADVNSLFPHVTGVHAFTITNGDAEACAPRTLLF